MTKILMSQQEHPEKLACSVVEGYTETLDARESTLGGGLTIRRALPLRQRRMIGPWCFLDHFGPLELDGNDGMDVAPHPHIGLQTVTWLIDGEVLHTDSLDYRQVIKPGQLNVMTSGRGISHSEETPLEHSENLHGLQFWVALPDAERRREPSFEHHPALPILERDGLVMTLFAGEGLGEKSPAMFFSPMMGADIVAASDGVRKIPLNKGFEHGIVVTQGEIEVDGQPVVPGKLRYLGNGREEITVKNRAPARFALVGGAPFGEEILMWWNFVARSREELDVAIADWKADKGFGHVKGYDGPRLEAPSWAQRPLGKV